MQHILGIILVGVPVVLGEYTLWRDAYQAIKRRKNYDVFNFAVLINCGISILIGIILLLS